MEHFPRLFFPYVILDLSLYQISSNGAKLQQHFSQKKPNSSDVTSSDGPSCLSRALENSYNRLINTADIVSAENLLRHSCRKHPTDFKTQWRLKGLKRRFVTSFVCQCPPVCLFVSVYIHKQTLLLPVGREGSVALEQALTQRVQQSYTMTFF